jgi:hypothetical protein
MSGKLNELIDLFVRKVNTPAARCDKRGIELEPALRAHWFRLLHGSLDARQDELPGGTTLAGGCFSEPPVEIPWQIDRGSDRPGLHTVIVVH